MRGLIFDFDGLILDTEMPDYVSWQGVYREHGTELPLECWATILGGKAESDFDPYDYLEEQINKKIDREAIWIKRRKDYIEHLESQPIMPGVEDYLRDAKEIGLAIGIASSSPENWVVGHLTRLGLIDHFDVVCTADDVENTKPDPALFIMTAEKMGVTADEVIVLEDSPNGILGAKRAGMFVVAVPNPLTEQLDLSQADMVLNSLADLSLEALINRVKI
ncbi:MAG: HAD family hydrolase [Anaerolineales bacterium]